MIPVQDKNLELYTYILDYEQDSNIINKKPIYQNLKHQSFNPIVTHFCAVINNMKLAWVEERLVTG
jgi:hypothetical protein